jgi:hypothetical protein
MKESDLYHMKESDLYHKWVELAMKIKFILANVQI